MAGFEFDLGLRQHRFGLAQFDRDIEAGGDALAHQFEHLTALQQRRLRDLARLELACQLDIGGGDTRRQQYRGGLRFGRALPVLADRSGQCSLLAAEQVPFPAGRQLGAVVPARLPAELRRHQAVFAEALAS